MTGAGDAPVATLRRDAERCLLAGIAAAEPRRLVQTFVERHRELFRCTGKLRLAALGKAAAAMTRGAQRGLPRPVDAGIVVVPDDARPLEPLPACTLLRGSHPLPGPLSVAAGGALLTLARGAAEGDLFVVLVSGGGSAMACAPTPGVGLEVLAGLTRELLAAGATIEELNAVRRQLDLVKGGGLAAAARPARVVGLVLSDVIGDRLDLVASGPTAPADGGPPTPEEVVRRYGLWSELAEPVRRALAAPVRQVGGRLSNHLVGGNALAVSAAGGAAEALGYRTQTQRDPVVGEARAAGRALASLALRRGRGDDQPLALVAGGEPTVRLTGDGRGGRNQELALAAAIALDGAPRVVVASLGTDGIDGPTEAAGAIVDGGSAARMRRRGVDPQRALERNDSYTALAASGDLLVTGPTGTNVADLHIAFVAPA